MLTVCCVLKSGPEYRVEHVVALRDGVRRHLTLPHNFICLTDLWPEAMEAGIASVSLKHGWPGWFSKLELFRPGVFNGPVFYLDLDSIIVGSLDDLVIGHRFTVLRNFWRDHRIGSGLMAWDADLSEIYRRFAADAGRWMREYQTKEKWGDQQFIFDNTPIEPDRWQVKHPGRVVSYKRDILRLHRGKVPPEASVIAFHGVPRPWQTKLWQGADALA